MLTLLTRVKNELFPRRRPSYRYYVRNTAPDPRTPWLKRSTLKSGDAWQHTESKDLFIYSGKDWIRV